MMFKFPVITLFCFFALFVLQVFSDKAKNLAALLCVNKSTLVMQESVVVKYLKHEKVKKDFF